MRKSKVGDVFDVMDFLSQLGMFGSCNSAIAAADIRRDPLFVSLAPIWLLCSSEFFSDIIGYTRVAYGDPSWIFAVSCSTSIKITYRRYEAMLEGHREWQGLFKLLVPKEAFEYYPMIRGPRQSKFLKIERRSEGYDDEEAPLGVLDVDLIALQMMVSPILKFMSWYSAMSKPMRSAFAGRYKQQGRLFVSDLVGVCQAMSHPHLEVTDAMRQHWSDNQVVVNEYYDKYLALEQKVQKQEVLKRVLTLFGKKEFIPEVMSVVLSYVGVLPATIPLFWAREVVSCQNIALKRSALVVKFNEAYSEYRHSYHAIRKGVRVAKASAGAVECFDEKYCVSMAEQAFAVEVSSSPSPDC